MFLALLVVIVDYLLDSIVLILSNIIAQLVKIMALSGLAGRVGGEERRRGGDIVMWLVL